MGKKNSKLKQETVDQLISQTYCEYIISKYEYNVFCIFMMRFSHGKGN